MRLTLALAARFAPVRLVRSRGVLYNRLVRRGVYVIDPVALDDLDSALADVLVRVSSGAGASGGREVDWPRSVQPVRIGLLGDFANLLSFPRDLLEARPDGLDLHLYDCPDNAAGVDPGVPGYAAFCRYRRLDLGGRAGLDLSRLTAAVRVILADNLHGLALINAKRTPHLAVLVRLLRQSAGPRLAALNCGCDILAGCPRQNLVSPPLEAEVADGRLRRRSDGRVILPQYRFSAEAFHYDVRGLVPASSVEAVGRYRRSLIIHSGRLLKLDSPDLIRAIAGLLLVDPLRRFVFWGKGDDRTLRRIMHRFTRFGVADRVTYRGVYAVGRDAHGRLSDSSGWESAAVEMRRAALFLNPFPVWGGSSVVEAYLLGVPVVHMLPEASGARSRKLLDIHVPDLATASGTARSFEEYVDLGARIMADSGLRTRVLTEQEAIARRVTDRARFWNALAALLECDAPRI